MSPRLYIGGALFYLLILPVNVLAGSEGKFDADERQRLADEIFADIDKVNHCAADADCIRFPALTKEFTDINGVKRVGPIYTVGCHSFINQDTSLTDIKATQKKVKAYYDSWGGWSCLSLSSVCKSGKCVGF